MTGGGHGRELWALPVDTPEQLEQSLLAVRRWYLLHFDGFAKAFHSDGGAASPLNLN